MAFHNILTLSSLRRHLDANGLRFSGRKLRLALVLIAIGVVGRIVFLSLRLANIETVMVASLLAGSLLGGLYVVIVPVSILLSTDVIIYLAKYPGFYPLQDVALLAMFVYSGFVLVSLVGMASRRHVVFKLKSVAILTAISIPATILYDVWTATGMWWTILGRPPSSLSLLQVYSAQVPFTFFHVLSSLIFVPLFGTIFIYYLGQPSALPSPTPASADEP